MKNLPVQKTILVDDEEKGNISLLVSMLSAENHPIFSVTDGILALDKSLISISNGRSMLS
jgi:CheY-like chemotaxis protein